MKVFSTILLIVLLFACKEEKEQPTAADLSNQMEVINNEIEAMISTSCTTSSQCMASAFGAKPCGGPWKYILHSTDIDLQKLNTLLGEYYELNVQYNEVSGIGSFCDFVTKPDVECVSGTCQEVSN